MTVPPLRYWFTARISRSGESGLLMVLRASLILATNCSCDTLPGAMGLSGLMLIST